MQLVRPVFGRQLPFPGLVAKDGFLPSDDSARARHSQLRVAKLTMDVTSARQATNTHQAIITACVERASLARDWLRQTLVALGRQEIGWIGAEVYNENGTYDLGPMQVNCW